MLVKSIMWPNSRFAILRSDVMFKDALDAMNETKLGIACLVDSKQKLIGVITDGDIRRKLLNVQKPLSAFFVDDAIDHAILDPTVCNIEDSLRGAIQIMEKKRIWDLPVVNEEKQLMGLLHLHSAVEALLFQLKESKIIE